MQVDLLKYKKAELLDLILSEYYKTLEVIPISHERALSHINNPRCGEDDTILITMSEGDEIIGYTTILSDIIFDGGDEVKMGWINATWAKAGKQCQNTLEELFSSALSAWNGRLILSNTAMDFLKENQLPNEFELYFEKHGFRYFIKSDLAELVPKKWPFFAFLGNGLMFFDELFNIMILPFLRHVHHSKNDILWMTASKLNDAEVDNLFDSTITKRTVNEMQWIFDFPWLITKGSRSLSETGEYAYPWRSKVFEQYFLKGKLSKTECYVMVSIIDHQMKIPFVYYNDLSITYVAEKILEEAQKMDISFLEIFDSKLNREIQKLKKRYVMASSMKRKYMAQRDLIDLLPSKSVIKIQDGEGNSVFV